MTILPGDTHLPPGCCQKDCDGSAEPLVDPWLLDLDECVDWLSEHGVNAVEILREAIQDHLDDL